MNMFAAAFSAVVSWNSIGSAVGNHLWQSTVFAAVAALLTLLLRQNHARTRYWLWLAASLKFLLPFALLVVLGYRMQWKQAPAPRSQVAIVMEQMSQPFAPPEAQHAPVIVPSKSGTAMTKLALLVLTVWFVGFAGLLLFWFVRWRRITQTLDQCRTIESGRELELLRRLEQSLGIARATRLVSGASSLEPGILGIVRPVMFLPAGIAERLSDSQLAAVIMHELCHLRRRDNLAAALHMFVEALFWFHPIVWWMGARLVDERERACDEEVLALGSEPQAYAEGILKVCEFYLETPLVCVAGITGSNLKKRIEAIMIHRIAHKLELTKKLLLATVAAAALIAPLVFGLLHPEQGRAQVSSNNTLPGTSGFASVMIRPNKTGAVMPQFHIKDPVGDFVVFKITDDRFLANNATLHMLIRMAYEVNDSQVVGGPEWVNQERYDVDAKFLNGLGEAKFLSLPMEERSRLLDQRRPMLQELWAERFKLKIHRETRNLPIYSLIIASGGPKMSPATSGDTYSSGFKFQGRAMGPGIWVSQDHLFGQGVSMSALAQHLSQKLGQQVTDNTGLKGNFDFTLQWKAADNLAVSTVDSMEQLGLQLVPQTGPVEMVVIDRAEPAEAVAGTASLLKPVSAQEQTSDTPRASGGLQDVSIKPMGQATGIVRERFAVLNEQANLTGTLHMFVKIAFGLNDSQLAGGPAWLNTDLYAVRAKVPKGASFIPEFQKLLTDRFKLAFHRELKELPAYEMVVGPNGAKLTELHVQKNQRFMITQNPLGHITGNGAKVNDLAGVIQFQVGRMVIDNTGLTGNYDFTLTVPNWSHPANTPEDAAPFLKAVSEQLGLELKPTTKLTEVLVIDHAEPVTAAEKDLAQNH